ncbi:MAG TPA: DUF1080 domain-containing protein [Bryobacteraceae bacterium]
MRTTALAGVSLVLLAVWPAASQQGAAQGPQAQGAQGASGRVVAGRRQPDPINYGEHDGWVPLFDGKTLDGWSGDQNWRVEDGAIVIEPSCEHPTGTVYLVWQGGEVTNFELKFEMKGTGAINSGMQYRSWIQPPAAPGRGGGRAAGAAGVTAGTGAPGAAGGGRGQQAATPCPSGAARGNPPDRAVEAQWNMGGPQYDFDAGNTVPGQFYEQATGRARIAWRGQVVRTEAGKNPRLVALLGDKDTIDSWFRPNDWNEAHIIALGDSMTHILNGHVMSILFDEDGTKFNGSGHIGIEVESTGKVFIRNIWLKRL